MQRFKNILRAVSGKSSKGDKPNEPDQSNELSPNVVNGLKKVLKYLETQSVLPRGLYKEPGFIEEITAIETLINSGKLSDAYLATVRSTHSIAMAIINVLSTHDPIIPKHLYDHFMSPLANLDALIDDLIIKEPMFEVIMSHLRKLVGDPNVKLSGPEIASCIGVHILRAVEDDGGFDSQTFESQARIKTFEKVLVRYIAGKEESERFFASANTANRRSTSLNVPIVKGATLSEADKEIPPTLVPPSADVAVAPVGTIQERSVKVIFVDPDTKPSQDELKTMLSRYGTVSNVGYKEKLAVVLFSNKQEAQACARHEDGYGLGEEFKIKYLGGALDPAPAAPPTAAQNTSADTKIQHFNAFAADSQSPPVSTTIDPATFSPNSSPAKQNPNSNVLNHATIGGVPAAADTSVLNKSATGWATAHKPTWSRDQDTSSSAALNSSALNNSVLNASTLQVSEFTPQATPRETPREGDKGVSPSRTTTATAVNTSVNAGTVGASSIHANKMNISREDNALPPALRVDTSRHSVNRSHAVNETLGVQDLSMVSFADSPDDHLPHHVSGAPGHKAPAPATHVSKVQPTGKGKTAHEAPSKALPKSTGSSDTEGSDGLEEKITYPSAPGSSGALRMPTRTVSPSKPTTHTAVKPHELARVDSTGSSGGSWKSAQLTRSPDSASAPPPSKFAQKHPDISDHHGKHEKATVTTAADGSGSDAAEETDGGEVQESDRQRQQSKGPKLANSYDSSRSTPQRTARQTGGSDTGAERSSSSDEGDHRFMSQLTTGTEPGSRRGSLNSVGNAHNAGPGVARFSTESLPQHTAHRRPSHASHHSERSVNEHSVRSGELSFASPGSAGSVHTAGELSASGGGSVKKRHIRTIQVGSPLNSSEFNVAGSADDDNYLQEEQSEKGLLSQMAAEVHRSRRMDEDHVFQSSTREAERDAGGLVEVESNSDGPVVSTRVDHARDKVKQPIHKESSPTSRQRFLQQPHFTGNSRGSPEHPVHIHTQEIPSSRVTAKEVRRDARPQEHPARQQENPEVMKLVNSLQERLRLLEAQVNLSTETDTFRKATQARMEEQWTAEILALNLRNQQTFAENALLQQQLQTLKIECANTQAALAAAEASRKSLLVNSSGLKDRAEHEALDTVIAQKRLIASLEKHLVECRKQAKKLEEDLGFMKNKHCETATSLISWKAKAVELSTRQFGSTGGTAPSQRSHRSADRSRSPHGRSSGHHRSSENSSRDLSIMDQEFLDQLQEPGDTSDHSPKSPFGRQQNIRDHLRASQETKSSQHERDGAGSSGDDSKADHKAYIGSANESRIARPADMSGVEYQVDNTFHTNVLDDHSTHSGPHDSNHRHHPHHAARPEGDEAQSDGSGMDIDARRKVAERITRQYISKLPAPQKVSSRLQEASGQLQRSTVDPHASATSTTHPSEPASTPYAMYLSAVNRIPDNSSTPGVNAATPAPFAPNPIYAHLLQHVPPPSLQFRTNSAPPTAPSASSGGHPVPAGSTTAQPIRTADLSERPDVTALAGAGVHFAPTGGARDHHAPRAEPLQMLSDNDRYAALFLKRSRSPQINQRQAVPYLSASQLYKSVPLSAEIEECEQRLHSMTRGVTQSRSGNASGNIYSTLARSYNSDVYKSVGANRVGSGGGSRFSATLPINKSADVYGTASAGPAPRWAQHKYL